MTDRILTANRLRDGLVVYLAENGWTDDPAAAAVAPDDAAADTLAARGREAVERNEVADAYLIDVAYRTPQRWREIIRSRGPTVRGDLGYQAVRRS